MKSLKLSLLAKYKKKLLKFLVNMRNQISITPNMEITFIIITTIQINTLLLSESTILHDPTNILYYVKYASSFSLLLGTSYISQTYTYRLISEYTAIGGFLIIVLLSVIFSNKKFHANKLWKVIAHILYQSASTLFMPMCEAISGIWLVSNDDRDGLWILHALLSVISITAYVLMCLAIKVSHREREFTHNSGLYKNSIFPDIISLALRVVFSLFHALSLDQNSYIKCFVTIGFFALVLTFLAKNYYYHSSKATTAYIYCSIQCILASAIGLYSELFGLNNCCLIYLLQFAIALLFTWKINNARDMFIYSKFINIFKGKNKDIKDFQIVMRYMLRVNSTYSFNRANIILYIGFNHIHSSNCFNPTCPLKLLFQEIYQKKDFVTDIEQLNYAFMTMINTMYKLRLRTNINNEIVLDYIGFLTSSPISTPLAAIEIQKVNSKELQFVYEFDLLMLRSKILRASHELALKTAAGIEVIMEYNNHYKKIKNNVDGIAKLFQSFWSRVLENNPNVQHLMCILKTITVKMELIENSWEGMLRIDDTNVKAMRFYSYFAHKVLNDYTMSNALLENIAQLKGKASVLSAYLEKSKMNKSSQYSKVDVPCIFVSTQLSRVGLITDCNMSACKLLGTEKALLKEKHVNTILLSIYHKMHSLAIKSYIENSGGDLNRIIKGYVKHTSGYILPIIKRFAEVPTILNGSNFIITLEHDNHISANSACIVTDEKLKITGMTSQAYSLVGINPSILLLNYQLNAYINNVDDCINTGESVECLFNEVAKPNKLLESHKCTMHISTLTINEHNIGYSVIIVPQIMPSQKLIDIMKKKCPPSFAFRYAEEYNKYVRDTNDKDVDNTNGDSSKSIPISKKINNKNDISSKTDKSQQITYYSEEEQKKINELALRKTPFFIELTARLHSIGKLQDDINKRKQDLKEDITCLIVIFYSG